jgi:hypothetical protein
VSTDDPKTPDPKQAEREAAAQPEKQTADELENLMKDSGGLGADPDSKAFDPTPVLYERHDARLQAEADILEEACDIVLPEIKLVAKPIREAYSEPSENLAELEALCGALPARHRQAEWLDVPAFHLDGATNFLGAFTDAKDGDTGVHTSRAWYLLVDGRLVEVHALGTWAVVGTEMRDVRRTIISTREVMHKEVVSEVHLTDVFMKLRLALHMRLPGLEGQHVPDLAERRARLDQILLQYMTTVHEFGKALRNVGDSPA